jgi:hypothetical protein
MGDALLSNVEERIIVKNTSSSIESSVSQDSALIPTAIVKPKYQKLSFDERQLPIRGSTDSDLEWANSNTITTTPRKVQKHLPKSQKSFGKQSRKLSNKNCCELRFEYDVNENGAMSGKKDIDCGVIAQNSVAIVQPIKKFIDNEDNGEMEKSQKIDCSSINSVVIHKHKAKSSEMSVANEITPKMSDCGSKIYKNNINNNNLNIENRKSEKSDVQKKVPMKTHKDISGNVD